ncbi:MAG: LicD family protein, partial [Proteobacteria bacterium]|nr:LicD family protein [Pseudomonadota bacterium]
MFEAKPQDLNRKNLIYVSNLLKGIEHFVFFGTLLGLVRDGDIIPHDDDVDFYVPIEQRAAVIERLKTTDFSIGLNTDGKPEQPLCTVRAYKFIDGMELDIDFYLYQSNPETDCIIERWNISGKPDNKDTHLHIPKSMIFPLKTQRFFDCDIAMPAKGEDLCEFLYGKDWRTPLRKYTEYIPEITGNNMECTDLASIPNKIYAFWMQGRENAPELVRMNLDRWEQLNPDYELIVLDKETAQPYLADFPIDPNKLTVQTFSDILRVRLLAQTGGIWTDASVYPVKPLSKWLHTHMEKYTFFIHDAPT